MANRKSIYVVYAPSFGFCVNSIPAPSASIGKILEEWVASGAEEMEVHIGGKIIKMINKDLSAGWE
jgi:hypothetical protein